MSDLESLQKFLVWKLIRIDFEVTSEVFQKFWCMIKFVSGQYHFCYQKKLTFVLVMMNEVPSIKKFGHTQQISKNFRSGSLLIRKNFKTNWWLLWCTGTLLCTVTCLLDFRDFPTFGHQTINSSSFKLWLTLRNDANFGHQSVHQIGNFPEHLMSSPRY